MLTGDLAAGKTFFVKALVRALGSRDDVTSPTYALVHFYETDAGQFLHADAFRLSSVAEYRDLGLAEYVDTSISAVEWGDKVASEFDDPLSIKLAFLGVGPSRRLTLSAEGPRWKGLLEELGANLATGGNQ